uniref:Uncharacterized protein n=1 Tax=Bracon brevicornis TaxID=1563983 RepID=A0A6V7LJ62_9HYME
MDMVMISFGNKKGQSPSEELPPYLDVKLSTMLLARLAEDKPIWQSIAQCNPAQLCCRVCALNISCNWSVVECAGLLAPKTQIVKMTLGRWKEKETKYENHVENLSIHITLSTSCELDQFIGIAIYRQ